MFEGLKKKFSTFIGSITKKEEEELEQAPTEQQKAPEPVPVQEQVRKAEPPKKEEKKVEERKVTHVPQPQAPTKKDETREMIKEPVKEQVVPRPEKEYKAPPIHEPREQPRVTTVTKIKGIFFKEVKVKEDDIDPFIEELRVSLLQSDVNYDAAEKILDNIKKGLVGKPISSRNTEHQITDVIRGAVLEILNKKQAIDFVKVAASKRQSSELPLKILFIGPNGAGKTTTMAKVAHLFLKNGYSCVLSASDTFRAAAIEQTAIHASRLGIGVIKGNYGADPASIAFDAIAHAKAQHIDVVLIDSAGRQETNKSLMEEVKKMVRVAKPDLKVFVGESIAGNTLLNQVREFNAAVGLDGVILTKLDCDAKGGNTLSIISEADVPVLYFGLGEGYDALMPYSPQFIIDNLVQNN